MTRIARYGKFVAHDGRAQELAEILLDAAAKLDADPGCELYLINRQADAPDVIWVTEIWRSEADLKASLRQVSGSPEAAAAMRLVRSAEMIELDLLGGSGLPAPGPATP
ncbi:putative quinol monooxygenase [Nonomuraea fastidiosa]|jgi:quinol monooxygenase YgiN|uniref:putative quinol monooxygenase n=1 Tax=Nonomuraea TaxID=83681 RepID=UPI00324370D1